MVREVLSAGLMIVATSVPEGRVQRSPWREPGANRGDV